MVARDRKANARWKLGVSIAGSACMVGSACIHVDLYTTGYSQIPAIGVLFLVQATAGVILAVTGVVGAVQSARSVVGEAARVWTAAVWAADCLFAVGTIAGYAVSRTTGLFGFHEEATTAGLASGVLEVGAFLAFGILVSTQGRTRRDVHAGRWKAPCRPVAGVAIVAAALLALVLVDSIGSHPPVDGRRSALSPHPASPQQRRVPVVRVVISGYDYHPDHVVARPGEIIAVTNRDQVTHTMTAIPGSIPYGGFNSGYIDPGHTVQIRAPKMPGTYEFYCSIHNFIKGVLVVK